MTGKQNLFLRQLLLFVVACVVLLGYFSIGVYSRWYNDKLVVFKDELTAEYGHTVLDERCRVRFGTAYDFMVYAKNFVDSTKTDEPLILLPSTEYINARNFNTMVPEPVVYYYFTGYKCVGPDGGDVANANYAIFMKDGSPAIVKLKDKEDVIDVLEHYKTKP